ncbi:MAG: hypothetical protein QXJ51_06140 [Sulfolobales archaeon]|jgi:hypothetical protein
MVKVLLVVMSGDEKADLAIRFAYRSVLDERFEDLKIVFFGPAQKRIISYEGELRDMLRELRRRGAVDSACIGVASSLGIEKQIKDLEIDLAPAGSRIAYYLEKGYQVLTF